MHGNNSKGLVVQERDRHLLRELSVMRVIDREQAKVVAGFRSTTRANVRLLALTRAGLLKRFFLGTSGAGKKALYALSPKGAGLAEVPLRGPRRRRDEVLATDLFITHQLFVNQIYCTLKYQPVLLSEARFIRWLAFHEPLDQSVPLIPDGYVEVESPTRLLAAFIEADLGTESLRVWKAKARNYVRYAVSNNFEPRFLRQRFRVLVVTNSERRLHSIRKTVAEETEKIFWFTTLDAIRTQSFWAEIWLRPTGQERLPLL